MAKLSSPQDSVNATLPLCTPNLMSFHINYSGPAPISTYFRVLPATSDVVGCPSSSDTTIPANDSYQHSTTGATPLPFDLPRDVTETGLGSSAGKRPSSIDDQDASNASSFLPSSTNPNRPSTPSNSEFREQSKTRYLSSFRGRSLFGLKVSLPAKYTGIIFSGEAAQSSSSFNAANSRPLMGTMKKSKRLFQKRILDKTSPATQIDIDDSSEDFGTDMSFDSHETDWGGGNNPVLEPTSQFSSFILWHPDRPVDEGRDEYLRSLAEWITLAEVIHQPEV